MDSELDGEPISKQAAVFNVAFGDEWPESGCLYSRSAEGSRDKTRCSTLWEEDRTENIALYIVHDEAFPTFFLLKLYH